MLNVEVRARRTLAGLANYQPVSEVAEPIPEKSDELGAPIGRYRNTTSDIDALWIFDRGISWFSPQGVVDVPFDKIDRVDLPDIKASEGLAIILKDGQEIYLPVRGRHGRFVDSMEILRFIDRVLAELRE